MGIVCVCVYNFMQKKNPECFFISFKLYLIVLLQISFFFPVVLPTPDSAVVVNSVLGKIKKQGAWIIRWLESLVVELQSWSEIQFCG